jgi:hypothetical protein
LLTGVPPARRAQLHAVVEHALLALVGAENPVTSRYRQVFVDQSAEAIPP